MKIRTLLFATILLSGCMAKKMAAENVDYVLELQIQKRIPLYSIQKSNLSKDIDSFLNEQKKLVLEAMPAINSIELNPAKIDDQYLYLRGIYEDLALRFWRLMSKYMAPLDEKQQKDLIQSLEVENKKMSKIKTEEIMKKIRSRFETLFGSISNEQNVILKEYESYFKSRNVERLDRRQELHKQFMRIYEMDISNESRSDSLYVAFKEFQNKIMDDEKNMEFIKKVIPTLQDKQKKIFNGRVEELKEILKYFIEANF